MLKLLSVQHFIRRSWTQTVRYASGAPGVTVVNNKESAMKVLDKLMSIPNEYHACDTEVCDIDIEKSPIGNGKLICASIYCGPNYDFGNGPRIWIDNLDSSEGTINYFKDYFENDSIKKVWHNYSFDYHILSNHNIFCKGFAGDTMHMARLYDSSRVGKGAYSLEGLTDDFYVRKKPMKELFGKRKMKRDGTEGKTIVLPSTLELQRLPEYRPAWIEYSTFDAEGTWFVRKELEARLKDMEWNQEKHGNEIKELNMFDFYNRYFVPFGELLVMMEQRGIKVDKENHLISMQKQAQKDRELASNTFRSWVIQQIGPEGARMNIQSSAQLQQLFFAPIQNKRNPSESLPPVKAFKVENIEGIIEGDRKKPLKYRNLMIKGLGIPPAGYTSTGWPSTDAEALQKLAGKPNADPPKYGLLYDAMGKGEAGIQACKAVDALCKMASIDTMLTTFLMPLPEYCDKNDRIHCSLNLNTETGRLSARRPNLQNQPAYDKDIYFIRKAFTCEKGNSLLVADYGQLELRVLAHITNCQSMIRAFKEGGDFHSRTAMSMYPYIQEAVDKGECLLEWDHSKGEAPAPLIKQKYGAERRKAKILNFSLAYGKTAHGLAKDFGVSLEEAQETLDRWYKDRPEVYEWQQETIANARQTGYTRTLMGRYRKLDDINSKNSMKRGHAERAAINTPIQGGAADIVMMAMIKIERDKRLKDLGFKMLLQIHDEVILEGPEESTDEAMKYLIEDMEHPFLQPLNVDLIVDGDSAKTWYEAK